MKKIDKNLVDVLIRNSVIYCKTGDTDFAEKLQENQKEINKKYDDVDYLLGDLIYQLSRLVAIRDLEISHIYTCLKVFGFDVVEEKEEFRLKYKKGDKVRILPIALDYNKTKFKEIPQSYVGSVGSVIWCHPHFEYYVVQFSAGIRFSVNDFEIELAEEE